MARQTVLDLGEYASGTYNFGPVNVGNNVQRVGIEIQRCTTATPTVWPDPASSIDVKLDVSFDNGTTWQYAGGAGAVGGIHVRRDGQESAYSSLSIGVPGSAERRLRGSVTIVNGPIRTSAAVTLD